MKLGTAYPASGGGGAAAFSFVAAGPLGGVLFHDHLLSHLLFHDNAGLVLFAVVADVAVVVASQVPCGLKISKIEKKR